MLRHKLRRAVCVCVSGVLLGTLLYGAGQVLGNERPLTTLIPIPDEKHVVFRHAILQIDNATDLFEPFPYLIEPKICTEKRWARIVLYVAVPPDPSSDVRAIIRSAWGNAAKIRGIEVVFAMGRDKWAGTNQRNLDVKMFNLENEVYGDILMANYRDSWEHLILKWWTDNHYHAFHCAHVPLMAFLDSDAVIFAENLEFFLNLDAQQYANDLGCFVLSGMTPIRSQKSRYYVNEYQWPKPKGDLHRYCSGVMIMASPKTARKLSSAIPKLGIQYVISFRIFDVVTGPIAKVAGVSLRHIPGVIMLLPVPNVCMPHIFAVHALKDKSEIRAIFDRKRDCCVSDLSFCPFDSVSNVRMTKRGHRGLI